MSNKRWENWIWKKELTFDFRGQNETKYNRISFLVLFGLTFWENNKIKAKNSSKNHSENKKSNYFFAAWRNLIPYIYHRREMEVENQKDKKSKPVI